MNLSVIIPTYKRERELKRLLKSLEQEKKNIFEIIVMRQTKNPSMTHARNEGARRAKGDILLFLDDDVIAHLGLINAHRKNFRDPKIAAICGRVITPGQSVEPQAQNVGHVGLLGGVNGGYSSTIRQEIDSVIGCNMSWRRDVYLALGGVDEKFTGNALREETDLSLRAKVMGFTIVFEPNAVVDHLRALTGGARKSEGRIQWYYDFFSNETYYFLKHRPGILLPLFIATKLTWILRCMFGFGREVSMRSLATPWQGIGDGIRKYRS